jgi:tetratricopeptide (TPR) repeat protein
MAKKKKRRPERPSGRSASLNLLRRLEEVDALLRRQQWGPARELLEELDRRYPHRQEVLVGLVNVYYHLKDFRHYQTACERLLPLTPDDPDLVLMLAGAYLSNVRPALAVRTFQRFLARWPDHPDAGKARQTATELEADLGPLLADLGLTGADALELATLHEEVQSWLDQGKYPQARQVAEQLLRRKPDFVPALNNLGEAYFREGQPDQALATAQRVLDVAPDNFHALSNLTRYLVLGGRVLEAQTWAERLKAVTSASPDVSVKKAEALSFLGDDQGVLDAFHGAERAGRASQANDALLAHLAAVAACRLGREDEARRYWRQALKQMPGLALAQANLDDLDQPVGKRHAPWAFDVASWVPEKAVRGLAAHLRPVARRGKDEAITRETRRYLQAHPELVALVPLLFDRGDPEARGFALRLALMAETPEMLAALRDFALGQRGSDELRMEAAQAATRAGLLPSGPVRMWFQGDWREILLLGFEVHGEPTREHAPQVEAWTREAMAATNRGDGEAAERLLRQALAVEPDAPDLLNNLAKALQLRDRLDESEALVREIHERFPDYLFGRTNLAHLCVREGELDRAQALLEPLLARRRLHFTEFAALAAAHIDVLLARGERDGARSWLEMWEGIDPDHPGLAHWRRQVSQPSWWRRLRGWRS